LDYAFKGDDDVIVIPLNLAKIIHNLELTKKHGIGCLKDGEQVNRDVMSKYFMPDDLVPIDAVFRIYLTFLISNRRKNRKPILFPPILQEIVNCEVELYYGIK